MQSTSIAHTADTSSINLIAFANMQKSFTLRKLV